MNDDYVEAWVVGRHLMPVDMPRSIYYDRRYINGNVVVQDEAGFHMMTSLDFSTEYEWV